MFLVIYGPTGVGKTEFAIQLARQLSGAMINADVGQFYTPLTIGTAKPPLASLDIPHCLFNVLNEPIDYTVVEFRKKLLQCLALCAKQKQLPLVVGGSGFYMSSIFFPPAAGITQDFPFTDKPTKELWRELNNIDPIRAQQITPTDRYRIIRALNIWQATGQLPSAHVPVFNPPPGKFGFIFLTRDRDDLYKRINSRVLDMIDQGWFTEVQALRNTPWEPFLKAKKLLGYPEIFDYLEKNSNNVSQLIAIISQKTRNYAKRQITFGSMLIRKLIEATRQNPDIAEGSFIETINLSQEPEDKIINGLIKRIKS